MEISHEGRVMESCRVAYTDDGAKHDWPSAEFEIGGNQEQGACSRVSKVF